MKIGDRVRIAPHSDVFMMGERWGEVVALGPKRVTVRGQRSGRKFIFRLAGDSLEVVS